MNIVTRPWEHLWHLVSMHRFCKIPFIRRRIKIARKRNLVAHILKRKSRLFVLCRQYVFHLFIRLHASVRRVYDIRTMSFNQVVFIFWAVRNWKNIKNDNVKCIPNNIKTKRLMWSKTLRCCKTKFYSCDVFIAT